MSFGGERDDYTGGYSDGYNKGYRDAEANLNAKLVELRSAASKYYINTRRAERVDESEYKNIVTRLLNAMKGVSR